MPEKMGTIEWKWRFTTCIFVWCKRLPSLIWSQDYILENATTPYMNLKVVFCPKIMANRGLIRRETHLWMMEAKAAVPACYRKGCFCDVRKWLWKGQCQNRCVFDIRKKNTKFLRRRRRNRNFALFGRMNKNSGSYMVWIHTHTRIRWSNTTLCALSNGEKKSVSQGTCYLKYQNIPLKYSN